MATVTDSITYDLRNGVQLKVWNRTGALGVEDIRVFLAEAMRHFPVGQYAAVVREGRYLKEVTARRKVVGKLELIDSIGDGLSASQWREAVVFGYSRANFLSQALESPKQWLESARRDESDMLEMYEMLNEPGQGLAALAVAMKRPPRR
jgi:hypothetical protein